jgi:3-dehydroquinate dehydratase II
MEKIIIINGANLNLLGKRETDIYGNQPFEAFFENLRQKYEKNVQLVYFQSNIEGEIINKIHEIGFDNHKIIINAGAYSHTSIAIADALRAVPTQAVEVHISNVFKREKFRQHSVLSDVCVGTIGGLGYKGYELAILYFIN